MRLNNAEVTSPLIEINKKNDLFFLTGLRADRLFVFFLTFSDMKTLLPCIHLSQMLGQLIGWFLCYDILDYKT